MLEAQHGRGYTATKKATTMRVSLNSLVTMFNSVVGGLGERSTNPIGEQQVRCVFETLLRYTVVEYLSGRILLCMRLAGELHWLSVPCFGPSASSPQASSKRFPRSTTAVVLSGCDVEGCVFFFYYFCRHVSAVTGSKPMQCVWCFLDGSECPNDSDSAQVEHGSTRTRHKQPYGQNRALAIEITRPEGESL